MNKKYAWNVNTNDNVSWAESSIFSNINGEIYLSNDTYMPDQWQLKIKDTNWKYGDIVNSGNYNGDEVFLIENNLSETIDSKIGLMYIHDYHFAYYNGNAENLTNAKSTWIHLSNNDENAPSAHEWTMSRYGLMNTYTAWLIDSTGVTFVGHPLNYSYSIRPVFYLNNSINVLGGDGTLENPYIIE